MYIHHTVCMCLMSCNYRSRESYHSAFMGVFIAAGVVGPCPVALWMLEPVTTISADLCNHLCREKNKHESWRVDQRPHTVGWRATEILLELKVTNICRPFFNKCTIDQTWGIKILEVVRTVLLRDDASLGVIPTQPAIPGTITHGLWVAGDVVD